MKLVSRIYKNFWFVWKSFSFYNFFLKISKEKAPWIENSKTFFFGQAQIYFFLETEFKTGGGYFFSLMEFSKRKRGSSSSRAESRVKFWQKELLQQSLYGSPNGEMRMATGRWMGKNRGGEIDSSSTYFTKVCVCMYVRRTGDNRFFFSPNNDDDLRVHVL